MIADMLKPYQRVAAERIVNAGCMLLSDQPGLGKTFTSLGALEMSGVLTAGSVSIVIAPLITCDTAWLPTAQSFMPEVNVIDGFSGSRLRRSQRISKSIREDMPNLIVTNHDSLGISKAGVSSGSANKLRSRNHSKIQSRLGDSPPTIGNTLPLASSAHSHVAN